MPGRERSFRIEAVVLKHNDWGEADRLLTLYSLELGKLRCIAKGARKPQSRKGGHLEPFTRVNLLLARGRDLPIVTQAETLNAFLFIKDSFLLTTYSSYVVELLDRFTFEEGENRPLYHLLIETLDRLSAGISPDLVIRYYELRLLDLVGFRPRLFECVNCGDQVQPEDQFFSAERGGVVCPKCFKEVAGCRRITMLALKYLRHFQRSPFSEAMRAPLNPVLNQEIEAVLQYYLVYVLERALNTPPFLRRARLAFPGKAEDD